MSPNHRRNPAAARRVVWLVLAIGIVSIASACAPPWLGAIAEDAPRPTPPPMARPMATPLIEVPDSRRPRGPWAVTFRAAGQDKVQEIYVLKPRCDSGSCDLKVTMQTYKGDKLNTGVFEFADGVYTLHTVREDKVDCESGVTIRNGAKLVEETDLLLAGYQPAGVAMISTRVSGTRTVTLTPIADSGCDPETIEYVASGEPTQFADPGGNVVPEPASN
jgi:hypothetical protein